MQKSLKTTQIEGGLQATQMNTLNLWVWVVKLSTTKLYYTYDWLKRNQEWNHEMEIMYSINESLNLILVTTIHNQELDSKEFRNQFDSGEMTASRALKIPFHMAMTTK